MATRKAVSVLLTRNPGSTEVYLVERNPKLRFFGGYYAFPGGTVDDEDVDIKVKHPGKFPNDELRYVVAAAREIFEETGILLTHGEKTPDTESLQSYRKQLLNNEIQFNEILQKEEQIIDAADFHPISNLTTPKFSPVRYATQFYWAEVPDNQAPEIWPGELVQGNFYKAEEAIRLWSHGEMLIVPPLVVMLQELSGLSVTQFIAHIRTLADSYERGALHQVYFTPGIQMLTLQTRTLPPASHTNTFLIGESELFIVDPASSDSEEQQKLWNYLDWMLQEGRILKSILLTHHHSDHVGALLECQYRYDLPVWAHEKTAEKLPDFRFERLLEHGDEIELGKAPDGSSGWKLTVFHTPGHARGHLAFHENRYGAFIAGDMISTVSTIVISPPEGHLATYMRSLELLKSNAGGTLYPSHGPAFRDAKKILEYYIEHRREREQKLLAALTSKPQSTSELVKQVYDDVDKSIWPLAEHSLLAGLIKLIEENKCRLEGERFIKAI
ncbi:MAG: MBL fold metallo-hydrolase [bacterium]